MKDVTAEVKKSASASSTHSARVWLFKTISLIFMVFGLLSAVLLLAASEPGAIGIPVIVTLLSAIVWWLADIADSVYPSTD